MAFSGIVLGILLTDVICQAGNVIFTWRGARHCAAGPTVPVKGEGSSQGEFPFYGEAYIHPVPCGQASATPPSSPCCSEFLLIGFGIAKWWQGEAEVGTPACATTSAGGCGSVPERVALASAAPCLKAVVSNLPEELISGDLV